MLLRPRCTRTCDSLGASWDPWAVRGTFRARLPLELALLLLLLLLHSGGAALEKVYWKIPATRPRAQESMQKHSKLTIQGGMKCEQIRGTFQNKSRQI